MHLRFSYHDWAVSFRVDVAGPEAEALVPAINAVGWQRTQNIITSLEALDLLCQQVDTEHGIGVALAQMQAWAQERPQTAWFMIWRIGWFGLKLPYMGTRSKRAIQGA